MLEYEQIWHINITIQAITLSLFHSYVHTNTYKVAQKGKPLPNDQKSY